MTVSATDNTSILCSTIIPWTEIFAFLENHNGEHYQALFLVNSKIYKFAITWIFNNASNLYLQERLIAIWSISLKPLHKEIDISLLKQIQKHRISAITRCAANFLMKKQFLSIETQIDVLIQHFQNQPVEKCLAIMQSLISSQLLPLIQPSQLALIVTDTIENKSWSINYNNENYDDDLQEFQKNFLTLFDNFKGNKGILNIIPQIFNYLQNDDSLIRFKSLWILLLFESLIPIDDIILNLKQLSKKEPLQGSIFRTTLTLLNKIKSRFNSDNFNSALEIIMNLAKYIEISRSKKLYKFSFDLATIQLLNEFLPNLTESNIKELIIFFLSYYCPDGDDNNWLNIMLRFFDKIQIVFNWKDYENSFNIRFQDIKKEKYTFGILWHIITKIKSEEYSDCILFLKKFIDPNNFSQCAKFYKCLILVGPKFNQSQIINLLECMRDEDIAIFHGMRFCLLSLLPDLNQNLLNQFLTLLFDEGDFHQQMFHILKHENISSYIGQKDLKSYLHFLKNFIEKITTNPARIISLCTNTFDNICRFSGRVLRYCKLDDDLKELLSLILLHVNSEQIYKFLDAIIENNQLSSEIIQILLEKLIFLYSNPSGKLNIEQSGASFIKFEENLLKFFIKFHISFNENLISSLLPLFINKTNPFWIEFYVWELINLLFNKLNNEQIIKIFNYLLIDICKDFRKKLGFNAENPKELNDLMSKFFHRVISKLDKIEIKTFLNNHKFKFEEKLIFDAMSYFLSEKKCTLEDVRSEEIEKSSMWKLLEMTAMLANLEIAI